MSPRLDLSRVLFVLTTIVVAGCTSAPQPTSEPDWHQVLYGDLDFVGDSDHPLVQDELADFKMMTGKAPSSWGRYLCNHDQKRDMTPSEVQVFNRNNLEPVFFIATTKTDIENHGKPGAAEAECVGALLATLRSSPGGDIIPPNPLILLDVEKSWTYLSPQYLEDLYGGLIHAKVLQPGSKSFGIYLHALASPQVKQAINDEISKGMPISVGWYARYLPYEYCGPPQWWQDNNIERLGKVRFEREILQYAGDCVPYLHPKTAGFDLSVHKPRIFGPRPTK